MGAVRRCFPLAVAGGLASCGAPTPSSSPASREVRPAPSTSTPVAASALPSASTAAEYPTWDAQCAAKLPDIDSDKPRLGLPAAWPPIPGDDGKGFFLVKSAPLGARSAADTPIELRIQAPSSRTTTNKLSLALIVANTSGAKVVLMRPMDGSTDHARFPFYDLHLRDEATQLVYRWSRVAIHCGNVNASRSEDHVKLDPAEKTSHLADEWASHLEFAVIPKPGKYTVWLVYGFCGYDTKAIPLGTNVVRRDTYVGVHASNAVVITVK